MWPFLKAKSSTRAPAPSHVGRDGAFGPPEQGVAPDDDAELAGEPGAHPAAELRDDRQQGPFQSVCLAGVGGDVRSPKDPALARGLVGGEACPICAGDGRPYGIVAELGASYLTAERGTPFRGYCCLVLKRHAVELHDLGESEASLMDDMRRTSRALQEVTGAVKVNVDIHGNTLPHLHVHFFPRYVGDPGRGRPHRLPPGARDQGVHLEPGGVPEVRGRTAGRRRSGLTADPSSPRSRRNRDINARLPVCYLNQGSFPSLIRVPSVRSMRHEPSSKARRTSPRSGEWTTSGTAPDPKIR